MADGVGGSGGGSGCQSALTTYGSDRLFNLTSRRSSSREKKERRRESKCQRRRGRYMCFQKGESAQQRKTQRERERARK